MIYLDNAATTFQKPPEVYAAVLDAMRRCANPGRGSYRASAKAEQTVFQTRSLAAELFDCDVEQVCFTANATEGLNIAIRSVAGKGSRVLISGLEHNAVTRPLHAVGAEVVPVFAELFSKKAWIKAFAEALQQRVDAVVCTQVSNVFGMILPIEEIAGLCRQRGVPLIVDASQSAGSLPVSLRRWGASYIAMPGHKGLYGPQGTGILICGELPEPIRFGGTGSVSESPEMPAFLPDRLEAGTLNVPGIAGLGAGLRYLHRQNVEQIFRRQQSMVRASAEKLRELGGEPFYGPDQAGVLSFTISGLDPEDVCAYYSRNDVCLRAGLHCAPLAHRTVGTFPMGTVRMSLSSFTRMEDLERFYDLTRRLMMKKRKSL